jgi:diguanylate cyclase (GGDEF)-like protein
MRLSWSVSGNRTPHGLAIVGIVIPIIAAALVIAAIPATVRQVPHATSGFWALTVLALLIDVTLFTIGPHPRQVPRTTLSACFTFAIFLLGQIGPAIVVQAIAGAAGAVVQRLALRRGVLLCSRLVLSLAAAELIIYVIRIRPVVRPGTALTGPEYVAVALTAAVWFVVGYALLVLARLALSREERATTAAELRESLLITTVFLLLVSPLIATLDGWWRGLILIPLIALNRVRRDITEREQQLNHEPVSGVLNRRGLVSSFQELVGAGILGAPAPQPLAIVMVNAEKLVSVSRRLGRDVYEKLVAVAASRLARAFGANWVGRLAGEGFAVLMPGLVEADALAEGRRVVEVLTPPIEVESIPFTLDPAVGIALSPGDGLDFDILVSKAEVAMADARQMGDHARLYTPAAADLLQHRVTLLAELQAALHDPARADEVRLVYQPQVDPRTGQLVGVEALVRWTHPEWGPVNTEDLIAAVEPTEVMHVLTDRVIHKVTSQLQDWNRRGFRVRAAVNISGGDLHDPGFPAALDAALRAHAVNPGQFVVEITETLLTEPGRVGRAANAIAALGVGLSLDDFGTGYASLRLVRELPVTEVKIDRTYIQAMVADPTERALVLGIYHLARALNLTIVAEGVEDQATTELLARLPGTIGQGWHFGRAMSAGDLEAWGRERRVA